MSESTEELVRLNDIDHRLIELAGEDFSDFVVADELQLSPNAVEKRWAKLRRLFGVHSRTAVLAKYYRDSVFRIEASIQAHLQLQDQIPTALFGFDVSRRVTYCNRAAAMLVGQEPPDLIGDQSIWKLSTPGADSRIRIRPEFVKSLRDFTDHHSEITRHDRSRVTVKWSSSAHSVPIYPFHWWVMGEIVGS